MQHCFLEFNSLGSAASHVRTHNVALHLPPAWPFRPTEPLSRFDLGVQFVGDQLLGDLARLLNFELLRNVQPGLVGCDGQNRTLHKWVHHAVLDGLVSRG